MHYDPSNIRLPMGSQRSTEASIQIAVQFAILSKSYDQPTKPSCLRLGPALADGCSWWCAPSHLVTGSNNFRHTSSPLLAMRSQPEETNTNCCLDKLLPKKYVCTEESIESHGSLSVIGGTICQLALLAVEALQFSAGGVLSLRFFTPRHKQDKCCHTSSPLPMKCLQAHGVVASQSDASEPVESVFPTIRVPDSVAS